MSRTATFSAHLQATNVLIEHQRDPLIVSAVYCPPKHRINEIDFKSFLRTPGALFVVVGDSNAKHPQCGSRLAGLEFYIMS